MNEGIDFLPIGCQPRHGRPEGEAHGEGSARRGTARTPRDLHSVAHGVGANGERIVQPRLGATHGVGLEPMPMVQSLPTQAAAHGVPVAGVGPATVGVVAKTLQLRRFLRWGSWWGLVHGGCENVGISTFLAWGSWGSCAQWATTTRAWTHECLGHAHHAT